MQTLQAKAFHTVVTIWGYSIFLWAIVLFPLTVFGGYSLTKWSSANTTSVEIEGLDEVRYIFLGTGLYIALGYAFIGFFIQHSYLPRVSSSFGPHLRWKLFRNNFICLACGLMVLPGIIYTMGGTPYYYSLDGVYILLAIGSASIVDVLYRNAYGRKLLLSSRKFKKLLRSAKGSRSTASGSRKLSTVFALKPDEEKTLERLFSGRSIVDTPPQRRRSTRMENDIQYKRIASQIKLTAKMRKIAHMLGRSAIVCTVILLYAAIIIPLFEQCQICGV